MKPFLTISALVSLASLASAATVTQTHSLSFVPDNSQVLTFNKFNSSLGTLTGVTITTNVTKSGGSLFVDNDATSSASGDITQTVTINLSAEGFLLVGSSGTIGSNVKAASTYSVSVEGDDGDDNTVINDNDGFQADGADYAGTNFGDVSASNSGNVHAAFIGDYAGTGTYTFTVNGSQGANTAAVSGAAYSGTPALAFGDVTVTYNYTPAAVPEPTSALLGSVGLLALLRRRR